MTLSLVITDIVDGTSLGIRLGNENMRQVWRTHCTRVRELIVALGGKEVKTVGDSFIVGFRTAIDAVSFAMLLHPNPGHPEISLRIGIHVGTVHIEDGDIQGLMVSFTHRVTNKARGAEIWTSVRVRADVNEEKSIAHEKLQWHQHSNMSLAGFPGRHTLWSIKVDPPI